MKLSKFAGIAVLAAFALPAAANSSSIGVSEGLPSYFFTPGFLSGSGWHDSVTFEGLAAGKYNVNLGFTGLNIDISSITLNGENLVPSFVSNGVSLYSFTSAAFSPFKLDIFGSTRSGQFGSYAGVFSAVAAVPEPETYALALTGLGLGMLFLWRSRRSSRTPSLI